MPVITMHWDKSTVPSHLQERGYTFLTLPLELAKILADEFNFEPSKVRVYHHDCGPRDITLRPLSIDIQISARRFDKTQFVLVSGEVCNRARKLFPEDMIGEGLISLWFMPIGGKGDMEGVFELL